MYKNFSYYYDVMMQDIDYDIFANYVIENIDKSKLVLDAGCGTGIITIMLKKMGYNICGLDLSSEMLSVCKKKMEASDCYFPLYEANIEGNIGYDKFDSVISFLDVINYCDYKKAFKNIYDVLKKDGIFIFDVNDFSYMEELKGYIEEDSYEDFSYRWEISDNGVGSIKHDLTINANEVFHEIHYQTTYEENTYVKELESLGFNVEILNHDDVKVFFKCIKK